MSNPNVIIRAENVRLQSEDGTDRVAHIDELEIYQGYTAISGASGSGKTSLARMMVGLIMPTSGEVRHINPSGEDITFTPKDGGLNASKFTRIIRSLLLETPADKARVAYRARHLGYIAQYPALDQNLTAKQNILLPHKERGNAIDYETLEYLISLLNMQNNLDKYPARMSGGERQRVAIIAALAHRPDIIVADEPTSSLDGELKTKAFEFFRSVVDDLSASVIVISHDQHATDYADNQITMRSGVIVPARTRQMQTTSTT